MKGTRANLLVKYETPEGKRGTLRIPVEWSDQAEKLFYPNKIIEAQYIGDFDESTIDQISRVFLRGGR